MNTKTTAIRHEEFSYQVYLARWRQEYGDAAVGRSSYLHEGQRQSVTLHKLSEEEFEERRKAMDAGHERFHRFFELDDEWGMKDALHETFPHELALLL